MKTFTRWFALALALFASSTSHAASVAIFEVPTRWRLENYLNDVVHIWYTSSKTVAPACTNGQLALPPSATSGDKNRLWSAVSTAKIHDKKMFVYFESSNCTIISFGIQEE